MKSKLQLPRWSHYLLAVLISALMVAFRYQMAPIIGDSAPFLLGGIAVLVSAYVGGMWPGFLATLITTVGGTYLFLGSEQGFFPIENRMRILVSSHITIGVCISLVCGALRSSELEAATSAKHLRDSRDRLDVLFNSITDKLITVSRDLRIVSFNRAASERWGLDPSHVGQSVEDVLPKSLINSIRGSMISALEKKELVGVEVRDEESERIYEVRSFPNPEGLLIIFHNIVERIRANEAIAALAREQDRANALLDSLLSHAPLGFAFFDRNYRCEKINNALAEINGIPAADHIGRSLRDLLGETGAAAEPIIDQVFRTKQAVEQLEITGETPSAPGVSRHWHTGFYPVLDSSGEVTSVGAVVIEITQRKRIEEKLRESEHRFRNLADHSPMMIWVCKADGQAVWVNQPWLDFRGVALDAAIQEGCFAHIHPDDAPWVKETYELAMQRGEPFTMEYRTLDCRGEYRWIHIKANPVFADDDQDRSFMISSIDVTDRNAMEENLRRSLANERAARSDAEQANRVKDEFLASLSHELRTPLTTVLGWSELLIRPNVKELEIADGLQAIHRSSKLQLQLINDLLDMSRISVGQLHLEFEFAELHDTVQSVLNLLQAAAAEKQVRLIMSEQTHPIMVQIDPDRFAQIIWNLVSNAIKFTPKMGEVRVGVDTQNGEPFVSVQDTGVGIDPEFLPFVFDRFRQADSSRSRRHGGLGLGLAIAKQLADLHGGSIEVESKGVGQGSRFTLRIPASEGNNLAVAVPRHTPAPIEEKNRLKGVCVLIVEDDEPAREFFTRILEGEGAIVIAADSAPIARRLLKETRPDVLVSDIGLPEEDGYQLIRSIRGTMDAPLNTIPAAALTAFAGTEDRNRAFDAGFNMYLSKPVDSQELIRTVVALQDNQV